MVKKSNVLILIILLVVLSIVFAYSFCENHSNDSSDVKRLTVSSGMYKLTDLDIILKKLKENNYAGYDNETLEWMKSLGDKSVFNGNGFIVIMDSHDAAKLKCEDVTDVYIEQYFDCVILENHSLGNVKHPRDVLLVKNVNYIGENITDLQ